MKNNHGRLGTAFFALVAIAFYIFWNTGRIQKETLDVALWVCIIGMAITWVYRIYRMRKK